MVLSSAINKSNKSPEYLHLREQLNAVACFPQSNDQKNNPVDVVMGYLGAEAIDVLRTEAENCLRLAEQHAQSHVGYDYCLRAVFYYQAASVLSQQHELKKEQAAILQSLHAINQHFPVLAFESALLPSVTNSKAVDLQQLQKNPHKEKLNAIRQWARDELERYQTQAWSVSAKTVLPIIPALTASLRNKPICFEEHVVKGDGNCGFTALATNRTEVVALFLDCATQAEIRKFLAPEIKALLRENRQLSLHTEQTQKLFSGWDALDNKTDALVRSINDQLEKVSIDVKSSSVFRRQGLEGLIKLLANSSEPFKQKSLSDLQQLQSQLSQLHEQLDVCCASMELFRRYVQQSLGGTEWLGYRSALLFARLKNYSVYIFHQPSAKRSELALLEKHESANATNTFYLLHTGRYTHYNILTETSTPLAKNFKEASKERVLTMQSIYQTVSQRLKALLIDIIAESVADYHMLTKQHPPCGYTFIALGSLAREAITPYSDLEFGLLIEDKKNKDSNEKNKIYFRNLCRLINLKLLALGETPANILNIKMPKVDGKAILNPIPKGLCFDACVDGGYKNPLGKRDVKGELIFELIGTPTELADYQQEQHYQKVDEKNNQPAGKLVSEPLLPGSLTQARLLVSGQANKLLININKEQQASDFLLIQYQQKIIDYLKQSATHLWGSPLLANVSFSRRQAKALDLLAADLARFRPRFGKQEENNRSYSVKHDLYRLLDMIFDQLALYYDLPTHSLWDQLNTLSQATDKHPAFFTAQAQGNLLKAIDRATEYRLDAYLTLGEQSENEELTQDYQIAFKGQQIAGNKIFYLPAKQVFELYNSFILLWQAAKWFCDSRGGESAFAHPVLQNFSSAAPWVEAQRILLLQGPAQALASLPSVVGTLHFAHPANTASINLGDEKFNVGWTKERSDVSTNSNTKNVMSLTEIEQALTLQITGQAYMESGRALAEAQHCFKRAQTIFEQASSQEKSKLYNGGVIICYLGLAKIYWRQSKTTEAQQQLVKAKVLLETYFSSQHPYSAEYQTVVSLRQEVPGNLPTLSLLNKNWHVPPDNKQYFIGRAESLEKLQQHFKFVQAGTKQCFISTISGLGGIGKTQLAIKFIHDPHHDYSLRLWFRAEQEITLLQDYIDFAQLFQLLAEGERVQQDEIIRRVKQYLETHPDWLAVYDNAEDYQAIKRFLPAKGGHIVVTTRASKEKLAKELAEATEDEKTSVPSVLALAIEKFSKEEALHYLKTYTSRVGADEEKAMNELAGKVDYLPLALAQAAAYIKRCGLTTADYLERYKTSYQKLLESKLLPADSTDRDKDKIIKTVATTWEASLQAIREEEVKEYKANSIASNQQPIAIMLLQVMSYLDADQIPQSLLTQWLRVTHFVDEKEINHQLKTALDRLEGYSLIQKDHKEQVETINIHRLVQTVIRDRGLVDTENVALQNNKKTITNNDTKQDAKLVADQSLVLVKQPPNKPHPSVLPTSSAMMADTLPMVLELLGNDSKDKANHNWVRVCTLIAFTRANQQIDLRTNSEIERAAEKHKQARRLFEQTDVKKTEAPLREAIKVYASYGDSYSGELCDNYLDLALLLHSQNNSMSKQDAKDCLTKAEQALGKSYGIADARRSRCKDVAWYLEQTGTFAIKRYPRFDVWHLPNNNEKYFTGRKTLLEKLHVQHQPDKAYQTIVLSTVSGLGGVGKTQLAIYYLYHAQHRYNLRAWFRAENAIVLLMDYRMFAQEFDLLPMEEELSSAQVIEAVKRYLEKHTDWLAVYDNAGSRDEIKEFLPTQGGQVIVTTRRPEWHDVGMKIEMSVFTSEEAIEYLRKFTGIQDQEPALAELSNALGYLPLALNQAGAYIKKRNITIQHYLQEYYQCAAKVLQSRPQTTTEDSNTDTVSSTWQISLQAIVEDEKRNGEPHLSFPVLQAMAPLHAEDISRDVLEKWLLEQKLVSDAESAKLALDKVIGYLLGYSLIFVDVARKTVSIHRLVQKIIRQRSFSSHDNYMTNFIVVREKIEVENNNKNAVEIINSLILSLGFLFDKIDTSFRSEKAKKVSLLSHMITISEHCRQFQLSSACVGDLLHNISFILSQIKANPHSAKHYLLSAQQVYIRNNIVPLHILTNLAHIYKQIGDYKNAIKLYGLILEEGLDEQRKATTKVGLAEAYAGVGNIIKQNELLSQAYQYANKFNIINEKTAFILGAYADFCVSREPNKSINILLRLVDFYSNNPEKNEVELAENYSSLGRSYYNLAMLDKAVCYFELSLKIKQTYYEQGNLWVSTGTINNLALCYEELGELLKARDLLKRAYDIREQHFGSDNPETIEILVNLLRLDDSKEKAKSLRQALSRLNSEDYPRRLAILVNLVSSLNKANNDLNEGLNLLDEAQRLATEIKDDFKSAEVMGARGDLYYNSWKNKHKDEALRLALNSYEGAKAKFETFFSGQTHPKLAQIYNSLGCVYSDMKIKDEAKKYLRRALEIYKIFYGENHIEMAFLVSNMADNDLLNEQEVIPELEKAIKILSSYYGGDHCRVAVTLRVLAGKYKEPSKSILTYNQALEIFKKYYGNIHAEVGTTLLSLATVYIDMRDLKKAHDLAEEAYQIFSRYYKNSENPRSQNARKVMEGVAGFLKQENLNAVCTPKVLDLLQRTKEQQVKEHFLKHNLNFEDQQLHQEISNYYSQHQNTLGAICHSKISLQLAIKQGEKPRQLASLHHNLACYYHCYAYEKRQKGDVQKTQVALKEADTHFMQGIKLTPHAGLHVEYGNYLLRQQRIPEAIKSLEDALKLNKREEQQNSAAGTTAKLSYSKMERFTLDLLLQKELDCWSEITIKATTFAHYLLVTAYHQQNNNEAAKKAVVTFEKFVAQENDPLTFSLLGHAQFLIKSYASATVSYVQASELKPVYTIAEQQLKQCQALLAVSATQPPSSQAVADTKSSNDSKLSLAALVVNSSVIFSSAATAAAPANIQASNPVPVPDDDAAELEKAIKLSLSEQVVNSASTAAVANPAADVADYDKEELQKAMQLSLEP